MFDARCPRRFRAVVAAAVLCVIEVAGYFAATRMVSADGLSGQLLGDVAYPVIEAVALLLLVVAARRAGGRRRRFFALMAASTGFGLCGDLTWSVLVLVEHSSPTPSLADLFYLISLALIGPALWSEFGSPFAHRRELLDVSMGFVIFLYIALVEVVEPQAAGISNTSAPALAETVLAVIAAIWVAGALITAPRRLPLSVKLVAAAVLVQAVTWLVYADVVSVQGVEDGSWTYTGWQATWAILIVAAVAEITGNGGFSGAARRPRTPGVWATTGGLVVLFGLITILNPSQLDIQALVLGATGVLIVVVRLHLALRERGQLSAQLQLLADTDALTGIANRRVFDNRLLATAERAQAGGLSLGMLVIDLDRFKKVNDGYGHPCGDQVLRHVVARLGAAIRPSDTLFRMGGEEFAVLAPGIAAEALPELAERCRRAIGSQPITVQGASIPITISVGAAQIPSHARHPDELVRVADRALYEAKEAGRNCVHVGFAGTPQRTIPMLETGVIGYLEELADELDSHQAVQEHSMAMVDVAAHLCKQLGVSVGQRRRCLAAARVHDIGKVGTPHHVLYKPGPLTTAEMLIMQDHVRCGVELLRAFPETRDLAPIVAQHHERSDGSGYPNAKRGDEISIEARIISVADAWTAMRADRPYRAALSVDEARSEMLRGAGSQFDSSVVACLLDLLDASSTVTTPAPAAVPAHRPRSGEANLSR